MFDVHILHLILHASNCSTLKESRKVCCRVLGFQRMITSEHSTHAHTHTHHDARRSLHDFLFPSFGFVVEFYVFIDSSHPNFPRTHHVLDAHPTIFCFCVFPGPIFRGEFYRGSFFGIHFAKGATLSLFYHFILLFQLFTLRWTLPMIINTSVIGLWRHEPFVRPSTLHSCA